MVDSIVLVLGKELVQFQGHQSCKWLVAWMVNLQLLHDACADTYLMFDITHRKKLIVSTNCCRYIGGKRKLVSCKKVEGFNKTINVNVLFSYYLQSLKVCNTFLVSRKIQNIFHSSSPKMS